MCTLGCARDIIILVRETHHSQIKGGNKNGKKSKINNDNKGVKKEAL